VARISVPFSRTGASICGIWRAFPSCRGRLNGRSIALLSQKSVFQRIYAPDLDPFAAES
jgi:hypothetical protein